MSGEAGAQDRGDIIPGPLYDLDERLPERLLFERRVCDVCARDDQRIEARIAQGLEVAVVPVDVTDRLLATFEGRKGKRINEELGNAVAAADQADELALGRPQRRIRHHVQEADVQFADVLVYRAIERQHFVTLVAKVTEGRQPGMSDERHATECNALSGNSVNSLGRGAGVRAHT